MPDKILSIVIPAYNAESTLGRLLESLCRAEISKDIEIIVVNDGSVDRTEEVAEEYRAKYPKVVSVISKENGGHGSGINCGIRHAVGRYFKVIDSDDMVMPESFHDLVLFLKESDADLIISPYYEYYFVSGERRPMTLDKNKVPVSMMNSGEPIPFSSLAKKMDLLCIHSVVYRTELLRGHKIQIDEHVAYDDNEYVIFPMQYVNTVQFFNQFVYLYYLGYQNQSVAKDNMWKKRSQAERIVYSLGEYCQTAEISQRAEPAVIHYLKRASSTCGFEVYKRFLILGDRSRDTREELRNYEKQLKQYGDVFFRYRLMRMNKVRTLKYIFVDRRKWAINN